MDALHIDRIDRPEFFDWTLDGVVRMVDREQVPALTTVKLHAIQRNLHELRKLSSTLKSGPTPALESSQSSTTEVTLTEESVLVQTTKKFIQGVPSSWEQIDAIEGALKRDYVLDPLAVVPADSTDAVEYFLKNKRGPAYLFATTATIMIRSIGYKSRLANGFYLNAETFDSASGQYLIGKKQLHWWPQVSVDGTNWISIEPTPGYLAPLEEWTLFQRGQWVWNVTNRWIRNHPWHCILMILTIAFGYGMRMKFADWIFTATASLMGAQSMDGKISWSLWLLDRRAELAGCPRPASKTQRQWFQSMALPVPCENSLTSDALDSMRRVLNAQDERLYSPTYQTFKKSPQNPVRLKSLGHAVKAIFVLWTVKLLKDNVRNSRQSNFSS